MIASINSRVESLKPKGLHTTQSTLIGSFKSKKAQTKRSKIINLASPVCERVAEPSNISILLEHTQNSANNIKGKVVVISDSSDEGAPTRPVSKVKSKDTIITFNHASPAAEPNLTEKLPIGALAGHPMFAITKSAIAVPKNTQMKLTKAANKIKSKQECANDMTVVISRKINEEMGAELCSEIAVAGAHFEVDELQTESIVRWKRKITRTWGDNTQLWKPCDSHTIIEPMVLVHFKAASFAGVCFNNGLAKHNKLLTDKFNNCTHIYLVEDLQLYYKKRERYDQTHTDRAFREAMAGEAAAKPPKKKFQNEASKQEIEKQILDLEMALGTQFRFNNCRANNASTWIKVFTEQISQIYEKQYVEVNR